MKILVTGGAGYVGYPLVAQLLSYENIDVTVLDKLLYMDEYMESVKFIYGDVSNHKLMVKILPDFDIVIHLAGIVGDAACAIRQDETRKANIESVRILAENFGGKIIFMSSCSVYGASNELLDEESSLNPLSLYAETKIMAEEILQDSNATIFRLGTLHGVSKRPRFDIVVNILTMKALLSGEISVFGGNQWRPLLGIRDIVSMITTASLLMPEPKGIYNIAGENMTVKEIADQVVSALPGTKVHTTDTKFEDNRNYRVTCAKAERDFGKTTYIHKVVDTIQDIICLHKEGRIKDYSNLRYSNVSKLTFDLK